MKKLSLLFMLICLAFTAMAQQPDPLGDAYACFHRSSDGGAVNPVTHTTCVPQEGLLVLRSYLPLENAGGDVLDVFIKNLVYGSEREFGDYWIYASYFDNMLEVPLPQVLDSGAKSGSIAVLVWGTVSYSAVSGQATFVLDTSVDHITYTMENDNIHIQGTSGPVPVDDPGNLTFEATGPAIIWVDGDSEGYEDYDDYEWAGYCEWNTETYYVLDKRPKGELKTYIRTSDCVNITNSSKGSVRTAYTEQIEDRAEIVFSDNGKRVYMKNPLPSIIYGTWIMGEFNDGGTIISVPLPQYLSYELNGCVVPLTPGRSMIVQDQWLPDGSIGDLPVIYSSDAYQVVKFAVEGNTIKLMNSWADFSAPYPNNFDASGLSADDMENNFMSVAANIVYTLDSDAPEATGNPVINGNPINNGQAYSVEIVPSEPSTIYYRVKIDNGSFSAWAIYDNTLIFNVPGTYSIEAYAKAQDKLPSETVDYSFEIKSHTGVSETTATKQVAQLRYFNVMGQEIQQPEGLTIMVTTYSDGSTTVAKVRF